MGSLTVRSKMLAVIGVALLLVSSCTSSGDAAESGPTTALTPHSEVASPTIAAGTVDAPATDLNANDVASGSDADADSPNTNTENTTSDNPASDNSMADNSTAKSPSGDDGTRTDIEPDGFDDGTVAVDTDGIFDDASVSAVILKCAAGEEAACGNLGGRLARSDVMSQSDRAAAICTAGALLAEEGQSRLAGIITLSLLLSGAEPSISGPIDTIRLAPPGDPQLDSAIAAASANALLSC